MSKNNLKLLFIVTGAFFFITFLFLFAGLFLLAKFVLSKIPQLPTPLLSQGHQAEVEVILLLVSFLFALIPMWFLLKWYRRASATILQAFGSVNSASSASQSDTAPGLPGTAPLTNGIEQDDNLSGKIVEDGGAEQSLRESLGLYVSLIEHCPVSILIIQGGVLKFANKALVEMSGYSRDELLHMSLEDLFAEPDRKVVAGMYTLRIAGRNPPDIYEVKVLCKDGTHKIVEVLASLITYEAKAADLVILRDITVRKELENQLRQAKEEAELTNQQKSRFYAGVSHEIRNPLNAIIGFTDLLKGSELNNLQKSYLDIISESGQVLLGVINDILDISKIEAGKVQLENIDFNLEYLIDSAIKIVSHRLDKDKVELVYDYPENIPRNYRGDPGRLRQILINLLSNATKFTEEGKIFVSVSSDEPEEKLHQEGPFHIKISVKDTGIGIPKDKLGTLFTAFTQKEASVAREYGGTGLGLYITKNLIELMNGTITVTSEEGKGSEFAFTLDLYKINPPVEKDISTSTIKLLKDKKVVIIEESKDILNLLEQYCESAGMQVICKASLIKEGLEWLCFQAELPDIVICGVKTHNPEGYAFARVLKREERYKKIKLVALILDAQPGTAQLLQDADFDGYLPKPVTRSDLLNVMRMIFGERKKGLEIVTRHMAGELILKGVKVLIVDDNSINVKLLQNILHSFGCITDSASNGKEAITKFGNTSFDAIFMDVNMPVMDGIEATRFIRSHMNKDIPIIALSGSATEQVREKAFSAGMTDFLVKPLTMHKLKEIFIKTKIVSG